MTTQHPIVRLQMASSHWLTLSLVLFGFLDRQMTDGRRILNQAELMTFYKAVGRLYDFMMINQTYSWEHQHVLLRQAEVAVLLKVVRWYEETFLSNLQALETLGDHELTMRYEAITYITRSIQTAPAVHPDQYDS
jgi:hypothetical protein